MFGSLSKSLNVHAAAKLHFGKKHPITMLKASLINIFIFTMGQMIMCNVLGGTERFSCFKLIVFSFYNFNVSVRFHCSNQLSFEPQRTAVFADAVFCSQLQQHTTFIINFSAD